MNEIWWNLAFDVVWSQLFHFLASKFRVSYSCPKVLSWTGPQWNFPYRNNEFFVDHHNKLKTCRTTFQATLHWTFETPENNFKKNVSQKVREFSKENVKNPHPNKPKLHLQRVQLEAVGHLKRPNQTWRVWAAMHLEDKIWLNRGFKSAWFFMAFKNLDAPQWIGKKSRQFLAGLWLLGYEYHLHEPEWSCFPGLWKSTQTKRNITVFVVSPWFQALAYPNHVKPRGEVNLCINLHANLRLEEIGWWNFARYQPWLSHPIKIMVHQCQRCLPSVCPLQLTFLGWKKLVGLSPPATSICPKKVWI